MIYDIAIVGAGIAGASLAATLDPRLHVIMIEQEAFAGYHATGRSASFWDECYGGPGVQPLTTASGPFLAKPPSSFADEGFLSPRGVLYLGRDCDHAPLSQFEERFEGSGVLLRRLHAGGVKALVPDLDPTWSDGVYGSACADIDVARLHAAYLGQARRAEVQMCLTSAVTQIEWCDGRWSLRTQHEVIEARILVNAAGAWADEIAVLAGVRPVGIAPYRRTVSQVRIAPPAALNMPLVIDINGDFYFKPSAGGRVWLSPHDETLSPPCDAAPEEVDIARAVDRFESAMQCKVEAVEHSWAGLRSFAPDRLPVFGFAPDHPHFFWCAGQGGFGIQTAPSAAQLCASVINGLSTPEGLDASSYSPSRFS